MKRRKMKEPLTPKRGIYGKIVISKIIGLN